jgi:hypothetical protein
MTDDDPLAIAAAAARAFDDLGIPYLIGGSLASGLHGVPRASMDVDILADVPAGAADDLTAALARHFFVNEHAVRDAVRRTASFNVIHRTALLKVDVFVARGRAYDREQLRRRIRTPLGESPSPPVLEFASAEDTILTKLEWYRRGNEVSERQWRDVLGVLAANAAGLDDRYLRAWAAELGVADLLARAMGEATANR